MSSKNTNKPVLIPLPEGGALSITLETITPPLAAIYLQANTKNRKPKPRQIEIMKRDILAGSWNLTHQGIAFGVEDADGHAPLLDGQHRLLAIIESDKPILCLVFRGLPVKSQENTDMGQARSLAENLSLYDGEANANCLCVLINAAAQCWARYEYRLSLPQTRQILALLPKLRLLASINTTKYPKPFTLSPVRAVCAIAVHQWTKEAASFHDAYQMGLGLTETHPAYHLRNACLQQEGNNFASRQKLFDFAADCLQFHVTGTPMPRPTPTGTGTNWLRTAMAERYKLLRTILRLA